MRGLGCLMSALVGISVFAASLAGQESTGGEAGGAAAAESGESSWLDAYLAVELQYDQQQIEDFKSNVAEMPEDDLRAMLRRLKQHRDYAGLTRENSLQFHERNLERLRAARSLVSARPARTTWYSTGPTRVRIYRRPASSLFRGYYVRLPAQ